MIPHCLFVDGGLVGKNPSKLGGTWCYCWVDTKDQLMHHRCGLILPEEMGVEAVTNNQTELLAAIYALDSVADGWHGDLFTDSKVTLYRIMRGIPEGKPGVPEWLRQELMKLRSLKRWRAILVGGHPTRRELERGYRIKNNLPVHQFNQFCDSECQRLARNFLANGKSVG